MRYVYKKRGTGQTRLLGEEINEEGWEFKGKYGKEDFKMKSKKDKKSKK